MGNYDADSVSDLNYSCPIFPFFFTYRVNSSFVLYFPLKVK